MSRSHRLTYPLALFLSMMLSFGSSLAQPGHGPRGMKDDFGPHARKHLRHMDRLGKHLIPPHLVMRHMDKLNLNDEQIEQIKTVMKATQSQALDLEIDLNRAMGKLENVLKDSNDHDLILTHADQVMALESKLKRTRLSLALQIKSMLTSEQLKTVKKIKRKQRKKWKKQWKRDRKQRRRARREARRRAQHDFQHSDSDDHSDSENDEKSDE